jgi:hypothetical protein
MISLLILIGIILSIGCLFYVLTIFGSTSSAEDLYFDLLRKTGGDRDKVERLIDFERQRHPGVSRKKLIQLAILRWQSHNR